MSCSEEGREGEEGRKKGEWEWEWEGEWEWGESGRVRGKESEEPFIAGR